MLKNELVETLSIGNYKSLWKKNDAEGSLEEVIINVQSVAKKWSQCKIAVFCNTWWMLFWTRFLWR